jgi:hypothetical protein
VLVVRLTLKLTGRFYVNEQCERHCNKTRQRPNSGKDNEQIFPYMPYVLKEPSDTAYLFWGGGHIHMKYVLSETVLYRVVEFNRSC